MLVASGCVTIDFTAPRRCQGFYNSFYVFFTPNDIFSRCHRELFSLKDSTCSNNYSNVLILPQSHSVYLFFWVKPTYEWFTSAVPKVGHMHIPLVTTGLRKLVFKMKTEITFKPRLCISHRQNEKCMCAYCTNSKMLMST